MFRIVSGLIAVSVAAFAALATAEAGVDQPRVGQHPPVIRAQVGWRAAMAGSPCWVERSWKRDYAGNLYLTKVRICA